MEENENIFLMYKKNDNEMFSKMSNNDRNEGNWGLVLDKETRRLRVAPIFDNGLSLLSDINDYKLSEDVFKNINKIKVFFYWEFFYIRHHWDIIRYILLIIYT